VTELNSLNNADLEELMHGACALLFPSFVEGFGLPLTEAAALGVPVIASDIDVFREIVARDVIFIDPLDAKQWKDTILGVSSAERRLPPPLLIDDLKDWDTQSTRFADYVEHR